ncbi:MAG: Xaa-Pro peptidase family protein [Candidatus Komeilibacteria bacterium]|nr:Xaa-Pro peptidase family protein [Candidatus Komeilibacteria bacterium]
MKKLIYANTKNADLFYSLKTEIPDPFFFLDNGQKQYVFLDHREIGAFREKNNNQNIEAVLLNPLLEEAVTVDGSSNHLFKLAVLLLKKYGLAGGSIGVPASFPLDLADFLRSQGFVLQVVNPFYPNREIKVPTEIVAIKKSLQLTYPAYQYLEKIFKEAKIKDGYLFWQDQLLTSEFLKREVEKIFIVSGLVSTEGMIIASGPQGAMPHHSGSGPILANVPIICDLFPRHRNSGYFSDMTRTYIKGQARPEVIKMYQAVLIAQTEAKQAIKPGVSGQEVYQKTVEVFAGLGYPSIGDQGFIHGTGHGLGLEIHETPYLNAQGESKLQAGNVVTVEPGLYFKDLGGIRIEDIVVVTANGCETLTDYPRKLKIFD